MRNGWNWKYPLSYMYPAHTQLLAKWSSPSIGDRRATGWVYMLSWWWSVGYKFNITKVDQLEDRRTCRHWAVLLQWLCFSLTFKCRGWHPLGGQVDKKDCRRSSPAKKCAATHFLLQSLEKKPRWRQAVNNTGGPRIKLRVGLTRLSKNWNFLIVVFSIKFSASN